MPGFFLQPKDIITLNIAADYAKKAGEAAAKAAAKAYLTGAESEGQELSGYAEEAKHFLANVVAGRTDLSTGHLTALKTGLQLYYLDIRKTRQREQLQLIDTEGTDERMQQLRDLVVKLKLNVQLELLDDEGQSDEAREPVGAGEAVHA
jgi:hypothetical protein